MHAPRTRVQRRPVHGVLLLDKPLGLSSNQALQKAKWLLRAEKAGHTGTLDPLASGVLPLCFGAATKFSQIHLDADKTYETTVRLGLKTSTVGGVISAGQVLMEILPQGGQLIVEAKVPTGSIDKVRQGLPADVRFSAFNQNTTPVVPGVVRLVGADKLTEQNGAEYYLAQVETTPEGLRLLGENRIQAGMPAEIVVKVGDRSFMSYLVKPLTDRIHPISGVHAPSQRPPKGTVSFVVPAPGVRCRPGTEL